LDTYNTTSINRQGPIRALWVILLILLPSAAAPAWYASEYGYRSTTSYTCVRCRAVKHVSTFFGHKSETVEETDYSRWFDKRQPTHAHQWGWCGSTITYYPLTYGRGCGHQHPIWQIRPECQRAFIENASPEEVETFFTALESPNRTVQQRAVELALEKAIAGSK
jgi:hypothetical protein